MTLDEAEAAWNDLCRYVQDKCDMYDMPYREPSPQYRWATIYELATDDFIPMKRHLDDPERNLRTWTDKYREMRGVDGDLDRFLIDRINEARRG